VYLKAVNLKHNIVESYLPGFFQPPVFPRPLTSSGHPFDQRQSWTATSRFSIGMKKKTQPNNLWIMFQSIYTILL